VKECGERLFVGVDEYDAPANSWLFSTGQPEEMRFQEMAECFKTRFFSITKKYFGDVIQKYWLTGVLPVFRDGVSPLTAVQIISMDPLYHGVCGFTNEEVEIIAKLYLHPKSSESQISLQLHNMERWYGGHRFCPNSESSLSNPQLVFRHLDTARAHGSAVHLLDEANSIHSNTALQAVSADDDRTLTVHDLLAMMAGAVTCQIRTELGVSELLRPDRHTEITWSLLYYFGIVSFTPNDRKSLKLPNVTMRHLVCYLFMIIFSLYPVLNGLPNLDLAPISSIYLQ
jgi:Predicted AAA-ATPase